MALLFLKLRCPGLWSIAGIWQALSLVWSSVQTENNSRGHICFGLGERGLKFKIIALFCIWEISIHYNLQQNFHIFLRGHVVNLVQLLWNYMRYITWHLYKIQNKIQHLKVWGSTENLIHAPQNRIHTPSKLNTNPLKKEYMPPPILFLKYRGRLKIWYLPLVRNKCSDGNYVEKAFTL